MGEVVPNVPVGVSFHLVIEFVKEPFQLWLGVLGCRLLINASRWLPDESKPLLPLPPSVRGDKVFVLPQKDLVGDLRGARSDEEGGLVYCIE